jgi:hypothetical protein
MQPPADARYGVWDLEQERWAGEWFVSDEDAGDASVGCQRGGGLFIVRAIRDDVDDEWLNELQD